MEFYTTTMKVLEELGAGRQPMIVVFNKIDKLADPATLRGLRTHFPNALCVSVHTGEGIPELLAKMEELANPAMITRTWRIPAGEAALLARLHRVAQVHEVRYDGADAVVLA